MIHSCTNISIKDDEKTVAAGNDDGDVGAVESDGNEGARRNPTHDRPLRKLKRDKDRYLVFTQRIDIAEDAAVIPNRWQITHPSKADLLGLKSNVVSKYTRIEQTIRTIGLFAMHAFWTAYSKESERKIRARDMLVALITHLLPYTQSAYESLLATANLTGPCQNDLQKTGCKHMRGAKHDYKRRKDASKGSPQECLAELVVALTGAVKEKCATAAFLLKRMLSTIARVVDSECERFAVDPRKAEASSRPDRQNQRGVRRSEAVMRALTEGIPTSGDAKSGHETAFVVHKIQSREMCASENQTTTQYRVCTKRKFKKAYGPWGSQNDGARLGNPAANTDLYCAQNYRLQKAVVMPNQAILCLEVSR